MFGPAQGWLAKEFFFTAQDWAHGYMSTCGFPRGDAARYSPARPNACGIVALRLLTWNRALVLPLEVSLTLSSQSWAGPVMHALVRF